MRAAVLFSGGKDSTLALFHSMQSGLEIKYLITLFPATNESYMFHHPNIKITKKLAKLIGLPIITRITSGEKEKELEDLESVLEPLKKDIDCVITGAIASEYQKSRIDKICKKLHLNTFSPLWHWDAMRLWKMCLDNKFKVMITAVCCDGLGKDWLGEVITENNLRELDALSKKFKFHLGGEGGEFETFVTDCPLYKNPLKIKERTISWDEKTGSGFLTIKKTE